MKIAAVVVTWNRKKLLQECLNSLISQTYPLDQIIVIDNASTDGTESIFSNDYIERNKIKYVRFDENLGSSGGFYSGIKSAYDLGFDWIWVMDDDAEPHKNALEKLVEALREINSNQVALLSNWQTNIDGKYLFLHRGNLDLASNKDELILPVNEKDVKNNKIIHIDHSSFVGFFINAKAIQKCGLPNKDLYYQLDDLEYCIRLREFGNAYLIKNSVIVHKEPPFNNKIEFVASFIGIKNSQVAFGELLKFAYVCRNKLYIILKYQKNSINKLIRMIKMTLLIIKKCIGVLLFGKEKTKRIKILCKSYFDGIIGKLGRLI